MRILLADSDVDLCRFAREGLRREGFSVDIVDEGGAVLQQAGSFDYDAILLGIPLPGIEGHDLLRRLRGQGYAGAILWLGALTQTREMWLGLNAGADDCLAKPFLLAELIARVRAVLRRTAQATFKTVSGDFVLKAGSLRLDLRKREVQRGGKSIRLTKKEFDLLECLCRRPGQVFSQPVLRQYLCNADIYSQTNVIEVHIRNLRAKIDGNAGPSLIRTVRGHGYALQV